MGYQVTLENSLSRTKAGPSIPQPSERTQSQFSVEEELLGGVSTSRLCSINFTFKPSASLSTATTTTFYLLTITAQIGPSPSINPQDVSRYPAALPSNPLMHNARFTMKNDSAVSYTRPERERERERRDERRATIRITKRDSIFRSRHRCRTTTGLNNDYDYDHHDDNS